MNKLSVVTGVRILVRVGCTWNKGRKSGRKVKKKKKKRKRGFLRQRYFYSTNTGKPVPLCETHTEELWRSMGT